MNMFKLLVLSELERVVDPEVGLDIVTMGLIYGLEISSDTIKLKMTLTNPACPVGDTIINMCKQALSRIVGIKQVFIELVWDPPWNSCMITEDGREMLQR